MENDIDVHFNVSVFLKVLDDGSSEDDLSSFDDGDEGIGEDEKSKEEVKQTKGIDVCADELEIRIRKLIQKVNSYTA